MPLKSMQVFTLIIYAIIFFQKNTKITEINQANDSQAK